MSKWLDMRRKGREYIAPKGICPICDEPTLMTFHPKCISTMLRAPTAEQPRGVSKLCATCPMRKAMPVWEQRMYVTINSIRMRLGVVQRCHSDHDNLCAGMLTCMKGGSSKVRTPEEHAAKLKVATSDGMSAAEWAIVKPQLEDSHVSE